MVLVAAVIETGHKLSCLDGELVRKKILSHYSKLRFSNIKCLTQFKLGLDQDWNPTNITSLITEHTSLTLNDIL